jgi:TonB family protein
MMVASPLLASVIKRASAAAVAMFFVAVANADEARPIGDDELAARAAQITVIVPPDYPATALRDSIEATVDVHGTVRADGHLDVSRIKAVPDREDFRAAVTEVVRFWLFRPLYDATCHAMDVEGQVRVWFEIKEGKPAISISVPPKEKVEEITPSDASLYRAVRRVNPAYPGSALRAGREGSVEALLHVADSGEVEEVVIVPGRDSGVFGPAIVNALRRWRFPAVERPFHCFTYNVIFRIR